MVDAVSNRVPPSSVDCLLLGIRVGFPLYTLLLLLLLPYVCDGPICSGTTTPCLTYQLSSRGRDGHNWSFVFCPHCCSRLRGDFFLFFRMGPSGRSDCDRNRRVGGRDGLPGAARAERTLHSAAPGVDAEESRRVEAGQRRSDVLRRRVWPYRSVAGGTGHGYRLCRSGWFHRHRRPSG
ncbi:unnamed protein product, partial [Ectocarpus sp. 12 AP-2014]